MDNAVALGHEAIVAATILAPLAVFGVAIGIGRLAEGVMRGCGRAEDRETRKQIREAMMAPAAMIEGVAIFAAVIAFLMASGGIDLIRLGS